MEAVLRAVPLFGGLEDGHLRRLAAASMVVELDAGEVLFSEGELADTAFVIERGEIEIVKGAGEPGELRVALRGAGDVIGETALLQELSRTASARAATRSRLVEIPRAALDDLMSSNAAAARAMVRVLLERWQATSQQLLRRERMAQLGTLTAGLAHELNNPAAAVARSSAHLRRNVEALASAERRLMRSLPEPTRGIVARLFERLDEPDGVSELGTLQRSDLERQLEWQLARLGVEEPWAFAADLVEGGVGDLVAEVLPELGFEAVDVLCVIRAHAALASLVRDISMGATRMSEIVGALKSHSHLDQGPVQDVDIGTGIADTLIILSSKLKGLTVSTQFSPDLPRIEAYGGELNQVWTNLIDNAADAVHASGRPDGGIVIRARPADGRVVVEVEDNGVGVPAGMEERIFDAFFTTKEPGQGTGLGLAISSRIVVEHHGGVMLVDSEPGRTVFRVELNRELPSSHR